MPQAATPSLTLDFTSSNLLETQLHMAAINRVLEHNFELFYFISLSNKFWCTSSSIISPSSSNLQSDVQYHQILVDHAKANIDQYQRL